MTNKNLQHDHCSSICNALMMITAVIETFAICRLYRFLWAVSFIIRLFSTSTLRVPSLFSSELHCIVIPYTRQSVFAEWPDTKYLCDK